MKTAIKKSLVLVAFFVATMVSYGNEISGNTNVGKEVRTNVSIKGVTKGSILLIKDMNGLILYKELINVDGTYVKGFDLTSLPNGNYYFELNKDVEIKTIPFKVNASEVTFDKMAESKIYKPIYYKKGKKIHMTKLSLDTEIMDVTILSEKGTLIFKHKVELTRNKSGRIYDFSTSKKGKYTIITKVNGRRFVDYVQI